MQLAEGIDTCEQYDWLQSYFFGFGCRLAEGYKIRMIKSDLPIAKLVRVKWKPDGSIRMIEIEMLLTEIWF